MSIIIGIGGNPRSGKDTCGELLAKEFGYYSCAFGDKVRRFADQSLGGPIDWERYKERKLPGAGITGRQYLRNIGEGIRAKDPDFWVRALFNDLIVQDTLGSGCGIVITDVRRMNEVEAIRDRGGYLLLIERTDAIPTGNDAEDELLDWEGWDDVVLNLGGLEDLKSTLMQKVLSLLMARYIA